jgi:hypothetical protein
MNSETTSTQSQSRVAFAPLKQKRRFKTGEDAPHEPVLISAKMEIARHRHRIPRSGHLNVQWRRVPSPIRVSEVILPHPHTPSPVLARVIDKLKAFQPRNSQSQGIWSLLRCWALALR